VKRIFITGSRLLGSRRSRALGALAACTLFSLSPSWARAQVEPGDMPGTEGAERATTQPPEQEVIVEVTTAVDQLPVLLLVPATDADAALADSVRSEIELTGLFATPTPQATGMAAGVPDRSKWPALTTAAVVVGRTTRTSDFPVASSASYHAREKNLVRRRDLVEYPGSEAMTASVLADAILEDVLGIRSHMSGMIVMTDATTRGERSVRVTMPDGKRGRRISGFGSLARGADFGKDGQVWYAAEDTSGKLRLFREREPFPVELAIPGYVQSVASSPNRSQIVLSMGVGKRVRSWVGTSLDAMKEVATGADQTALSPSVDDQGRVVHTMGPEKGPFSIYVGGRRLTPPGMWAAMPQFCSTVMEDRVVYMVRAGTGWNVRVTSLTSGNSRTIAVNAMSPACSPDGRTVAFFSTNKSGKGPGIYLISDTGGVARKVWDGQAAGLRWRTGERLPRRIEEPIAPPTPPTAEAPSAAPPEPSPPLQQDTQLDATPLVVDAESDPELLLELEQAP